MNEREVARELLRELLAQHGTANGGPPAQVPPPPVAAVHRPSSWQQAEGVTIASDADLERFVRALADRMEDPAERAAIRDGRRRFTLGGAAAPAPSAAAGTVRVERGAVTERTVADAARKGARLVVGPRAVLTPLAREKARAAGVEIERER